MLLNHSFTPFVAFSFSFVANGTTRRITYLSTLVNEGRMKVILDKEYPIEQISAAHYYSETKRAKGKITVRF
jgi:NADPH:quinone reductase-like Zn-dependent oxidoreductase